MLNRRESIVAAVAGVMASMFGWKREAVAASKPKQLEAHFFCGNGNRYKAKWVESIGGHLNVHLAMKEFPGETITALEFYFNGNVARLRVNDCVVPTVFGDYDEIIANTALSIECCK